MAAEKEDVLGDLNVELSCLERSLLFYVCALMRYNARMRAKLRVGTFTRMRKGAYLLHRFEKTCTDV